MQYCRFAMKNLDDAFTAMEVVLLLQQALQKPVKLGLIIWPGVATKSENPAPVDRWGSGNLTGSGKKD